MARATKTPETSWIMGLASVAIIVGALYLAKGVLIPLTLAILLTFLLTPVCNWLERRNIPRIAAVFLTTLLGFSIVGIVAWTAAGQLAQLARKLPEHRQNIVAKLGSVSDYAGAALSQLTQAAQMGAPSQTGQSRNEEDNGSAPRGTEDQPLAVRVLNSPENPLRMVGGVLGNLLEALATTGIVVVLVMFFLFQREDLRDRFIRLAGKRQVTLTTQMLEDAGTRVSHYLSTLLFLNVVYGICVAVGLYLIGVPSPILWGILSGTLRFVPFLGPWISSVLPIGLSMVTSTGWGPMFMTIALFVALELFNNNLLEPWLYGKNTGVSPVAIIVAAVFWTWLWGPMGLLLATPLTVCVMVVGKHVPQLSFLDTILGSDPVFEPHLRLYQRLLAGDQEEVAEMIDEALEKQPLAEVYDTLVIPALALVEKHWQAGDLEEGKHTHIMRTLKELIEDRDESPQQPGVETETALSLPGAAEAPPLTIYCLAARTEADEISSMLLAQVLESGGRDVRVVSTSSLPDELPRIVDQGGADVIYVSATPPAAVLHARQLCKFLKSRQADVRLIVGLWNAQGDLEKARQRIGGDAIVVTTLGEAEAQIRLLTGSQLPPG